MAGNVAADTPGPTCAANVACSVWHWAWALCAADRAALARSRSSPCCRATKAPLRETAGPCTSTRYPPQPQVLPRTFSNSSCDTRICRSLLSLATPSPSSAVPDSAARSANADASALRLRAEASARSWASRRIPATSCSEPCRTHTIRRAGTHSAGAKGQSRAAHLLDPRALVVDGTCDGGHLRV